MYIHKILEKEGTYTMNRRFRNRDDRNIARRHRSTRNVILEMQAKTMAYRAFLVDYARWEQTEEYQEECRRLKKLMAEVDAELAQEDPRNQK